MFSIFLHKICITAYHSKKNIYYHNYHDLNYIYIYIYIYVCVCVCVCVGCVCVCVGVCVCVYTLFIDFSNLRTM